MTKHTTYTAFVSYSHRDDKWARWLLRALETYNVPRHLVGTNGTNGPVPAKLTRIFRDREELAAGACLDTKIQEALKQSQTLLVVCSPNAVHSYGVNQEIKMFREMRGDDHIFYIIKDGEPHAEARGLDPELECFPTELLNHSMETSTAYGVPLAADARDKGDGKKMALLKVVAGILGVNLDTLVRRDLQRRQRRLWTFMLTASFGMLLTTGLAMQAYLASKKAEEALDHARRQQDEAESLITYIVDDLGLQLWRRGHADLLQAMSTRILEHYDGQNSPDMGPKEIARKVRGLSVLARTRIFKGDTSEIVERLQDLRLATQDVIEKHPADIQVMQTHILTLKLLSDINILEGNYEAARALITEQIEVSHKIYALEPERDPNDKATLANALIDLGWVNAHADQNPEKAYELIKQGQEIRIAVGQLPRNVNTFRRLDNVAGGYHHLSLIQEITEPLSIAIATRQKCLDTYLERQALAPGQQIYKLLYYRFHNELAELLLHSGQDKAALEALSFGQSNLNQLLETDQENYRYLVMAARSELIRGLLLMTLEQWSEAETAFVKAAEGMIAQSEQSLESSDTRNWVLTAKTLRALSVAKQGHVTEAAKLMDDAVQEVDQTPARLLHSVFGRKMRAIHANARAELAQIQGDPDLARVLWLELIDAMGAKWQQSHPVVRFELMKAYIGVGDVGAATGIAENLRSIGFARPDFLAELAKLEQSSAEATNTGTP